MAQSGNRPPRGGQSKARGGQAKSADGNRPPRNERAATEPPKDAGTDKDAGTESAAERARERLAQQSASGQKRQSASQRARAGGPASQRPRTGGPSSRRGSAKSAAKHSTARTAGIFGTALVVLAVLVIILVSIVGKTTPANAADSKPAPASVTNTINHTPASAFEAAGSTPTSSGPYMQAIFKLKGQPKLTQDGKPLIVYVGSEYCPYCAATRWPLALALGRFGTFSRLRVTHSSTTDAYANTPTLSFHGSTYTSPYIVFSPTEQCTNIPSTSTSAAVQACNGYKPLENWSPTAERVFLKYDEPPFVPNKNNEPGGIPFVDFANHYHEDGAFIDPAILAGLTQVRIVESLNNPAALPAQPILVAANYYSAMICKLTNNKPASVCQMPAVKQAGILMKL